MDSADSRPANIDKENEPGLPFFGTVFEELARDLEGTGRGRIGKQIDPPQDAAQRNPDMDQRKSR